MSQKTFSLVAGLIFLVVAVMHLLRLGLGWHVALAGWAAPMWVSWIASLIATSEFQGPATIRIC
jgi:hypothetical protein